MQDDLTLDLQDKVQELVSAHLPRQVGEALQNRLSVVADLEQQIATLKNELRQEKNKSEYLTEKRDEAEKRADRQYILDARHASQEERERLLVDRENRLELSMLQVELRAANERSNAVFDLVKLVFKHPTLIRSETTSRQEPLGGGQYGTVQLQDHVSITETLEKT